MPLLSVRDLSIRFGGVVALDNVSFDVEANQIVGLIGPNGAGKTTCFNCLSRLYQAQGGSVMFDNTPLLQLPAHRMAALGISRTFQNLALFPRLTILQNVLIGGHARARAGFLASALRLPWVGKEEETSRRAAMDVLEFVGLAALADRPAAGLPFATLKRVELARALAPSPRLLMMDEPAGGLNHDEVQELGALIRRLRDQRKLTILLVEHHMGLVMSVSDRVVVLNFGRRIAQGTPAEVRRDPAVVQAYLGAPEGEEKAAA